jgi:dTDP-glucose pyrophosphorylase
MGDDLNDGTTEVRLDLLLVAPDLTIGRALKRMDESGDRIVIVVDEIGRLLGVATDGDVRRWILAGKSLDEPISAVANTSPIVLPAGHSSDQARGLILEHRIDCIPVVDSGSRVVGLERWVDLIETKRRKYAPIDLPVVIMAGGEGTRLAPFTKVLPKPLVPVGDKPIVEHIIERFTDAGCSRFYLSVNYKANLIRAYFSDFEHDFELRYLDEEQPLGTAGSLSLLRGKMDDAFFVSNCDILIDADYADFYRFHKEGGHAISLIASMKELAVPYGVCDIAPGGALTRILEKPEYNFLVSTGLYLLEPSVLNDIEPGVHLNITDLMNDYIARGISVGVYPVSERSWMDMGQWDEFQKMLDGMGMR